MNHNLLATKVLEEVEAYLGEPSPFYYHYVDLNNGDVEIFPVQYKNGAATKLDSFIVHVR